MSFCRLKELVVIRTSVIVRMEVRSWDVHTGVEVRVVCQ